jgi:N-acetylmuramate 1-kinase
MTTRLGEINQWLAEIFPDHDLSLLKYIQADASDRKYLRLTLATDSYIVMDSRPGVELQNFIDIAKLLSEHQVNVPKIINTDTTRGLILMHDFGSHTYLNMLQAASPDQVNKLYSDALKSLIKIQSIGNRENSFGLPVMNAEYISGRMEVFKSWYLQKHLQREVDPTAQDLIDHMQMLFLDVFENQPQVLVHLDYHSRNLMYLTHGDNPGILDFQDAMYGPITYDLVSLFQDAYITWPRSKVEAWIELYAAMALDAALINTQEADNLLRNFDLVGLQRHVKNLGVFARLHHRDQKSHYLNDIPTLLKYIVSTCERYPELHKFLGYLRDTVTMAAD